MHTSLLAGVLSGLALIVAIGAQNAYVLRQGIRQSHVWLVVLTCVCSDVALIGLGVVGVGAAIAQVPSLLVALRWAGAAYLMWLGVKALRSARRPQTLLGANESDSALRTVNADNPAAGIQKCDAAATCGDQPTVPSAKMTETRSAVLMTTLTLTWLNPHVYLDTVILLGNLAQQHGDRRWVFAAGAMAASVTWFTLLGFGAVLLRPFFQSARSWQILDIGVGLTMITLAVFLIVH